MYCGGTPIRSSSLHWQDDLPIPARAAAASFWDWFSEAGRYILANPNSVKAKRRPRPMRAALPEGHPALGAPPPCCQHKQIKSLARIKSPKASSKGDGSFPAVRLHLFP